jgi:Kef-type K+ transport system membrane component KefB
MNTRGLMELIVLNIGLDLKVISPTLAMLVMMAIVTTMLTTPMLDLLTSGAARADPVSLADVVSPQARAWASSGTSRPRAPRTAK